VKYRFDSFAIVVSSVTTSSFTLSASFVFLTEKLSKIISFMLDLTSRHFYQKELEVPTQSQNLRNDK
jgi:hypothetical protein